MNCQEFREELAAYIEGLLDETHGDRWRRTWPSVQAVRPELQEVRELTVRLARERRLPRRRSLWRPRSWTGFFTNKPFTEEIENEKANSSAGD